MNFHQVYSKKYLAHTLLNFMFPPLRHQVVCHGDIISKARNLKHTGMHMHTPINSIFFHHKVYSSTKVGEGGEMVLAVMKIKLVKITYPFF